ncbi:MAG: hypothetical protein FJX72_01525 [Armatimonadetes bacterium]|nr:hypothetical protein [Armatimonadota bacterium]
MGDSDAEPVYVACPLSRFSPYTHIWCGVVRALGDEIRSSLDRAFVTDGIDAGEYQHACARFWLRVLGAYEVVRTMAQAGDCFSERARGSLANLKGRLGPLRVAFAKQEQQGKKRPIGNEASVYDFGMVTRDLLFRVADQPVSARELIGSFEETMAAITANDILKDHRESRAFGGN